MISAALSALSKRMLGECSKSHASRSSSIRAGFTSLSFLPTTLKQNHSQRELSQYFLQSLAKSGKR
jgi:hypothetical protein